MKIELTPWFLDSNGNRQKTAIMEVPDDASIDLIEDLAYEYKVEFLQIDCKKVKGQNEA